MMPLCLAQPDEENIIRRIGGSPGVKRHLDNLGFVVGGTCRLVSVINGNVIVKDKESRIAISREMAPKSMFGSAKEAES